MPNPALRIGRAAAFLMLASGISGVAPAVSTSLDTRWIFVAAVGIVALLDGWVIGIVSAAAAVACHQLVSSGALSFATGRDGLLLGLGVAATIAANTVREAFPHPLAAPAPRLLLSPVEPGAAPAEGTLDGELERLRASLETRTRERDAALEELLAAQRRAGENRREAALAVARAVAERDDAERAWSERLGAREAELNASNLATLDAEQIASVALSRSQSLDVNIASMEQEILTARGVIREHLASIETLQFEHNDLRERGFAMAENSRTLLLRIEELEAGNAALQQSAAAAAEAGRRREIELSEHFHEALATARAEADQSRHELDSSAAAIAGLRQRIAALEEERDAVFARLTAKSEDASNERQARDEAEFRLAELHANSGGLVARAAGHEREIAELRSAHAAASETFERSAAAAAEMHHAELEAAAGREAALAGRFAALAAAAEESVNAHGGLRAELTSIRTELSAREEALRESMTRVAQAEALRTAADEDRGSLRRALEEATGEVEALSEQLADARLAAAEAAPRAEEARAIAERLARTEVRADSATAESRQLLARVRELERQNAELRAAPLTPGSEEVGRLRVQLASATQSLTAANARTDRHAERVAELESGHEQLKQIANDALGEVVRVEQRTDALRAEATAQATRIAELERLNESLRDGSVATSAAARVEQLETEIVHLRADHDRKLNTIVSHLASDHETDLGQALLEREEARAELRRLEMKANQVVRENKGLRDQLEEARKQREELDAQWSQKLQTIVTHIASDHETDVGQVLAEREEARAGARSLQMKLATLQRTLESERTAFLRDRGEWLSRNPSAQDGTAAPPRARILLVHPDADMRLRARDELTASGYEVLTTAEGLDAVNLAFARPPDVVVAEAKMPEMDARELVRILQSRPETAGIRFVIVNTSGSADETIEPGEQSHPTDIPSLKVALSGIFGGDPPV